MKFLNLSLATLIFRFYLMMAIIIIAGFSGLWILSVLALPVFFSALMGIRFNKYFTIRKSGQAGHSHESSHRQPLAH
jgi:hypothetical protein